MNKTILFEHRLGIFIILILLILTYAPLTIGQPLIQEQSGETQGGPDVIEISGWMGEDGWYRSGVTITIHPPHWTGVYYQINDMAWCEYMWPLYIGEDGVYTFSCYFVDDQGNHSETYTESFKIDTTLPVIHLEIKKIDFLRYFITLQGYDNTSGLACLQIYLDDALVAECTSEPFELTLSLKNVMNSVLKIIVYDNAGNVSPGLFGLFHLQYSLTVAWNGSQINTPISNGETRTVNMSVSSTVNKGLFGRYLLRLLEGTPYTIHLSVIETPDWCDPWFTAENLTAVIHPGEIETSEAVLCIHVQDDAPRNYTMGWVDMRASVEPLIGPFHLFTLIHGFEQNFTITFINK